MSKQEKAKFIRQLCRTVAEAMQIGREDLGAGYLVTSAREAGIAF